MGQILGTEHFFRPMKYKSLIFSPKGRPRPHLPVTSLVNNITNYAYSNRWASQSRHTGGPVLLEVHTSSSQLHNSSQHVLRSSYLAPSNTPYMSKRLKTVAKLPILILQLSKQIKCFHELDNQEFSHKGESC